MNQNCKVVIQSVSGFCSNTTQHNTNAGVALDLLYSSATVASTTVYITGPVGTGHIPLERMGNNFSVKLTTSSN